MLATHVNPERVLFESDLGIAYSSVPADYEGPCQVQATSSITRTVVFPNVREADNAASFAIGVLGGYHTARVEPAPDAVPAYLTWTDWAFET